MDTELAGRVALVVGGGTGIGRATAMQFAREGAAVVVAGRRFDPLQEVVRTIEELGGEAMACRPTSPNQMTSMRWYRQPSIASARSKRSRTAPASSIATRPC